MRNADSSASDSDNLCTPISDSNYGRINRISVEKVCVKSAKNTSKSASSKKPKNDLTQT